eukprot:5861691-Pleurochrysis_carterae.AAC.1
MEDALPPLAAAHRPVMLTDVYSHDELDPESLATGPEDGSNGRAPILALAAYHTRHLLLEDSDLPEPYLSTDAVNPEQVQLPDGST